MQFPAKGSNVANTPYQSSIFTPQAFQTQYWIHTMRTSTFKNNNFKQDIKMSYVLRNSICLGLNLLLKTYRAVQKVSIDYTTSANTVCKLALSTTTMFKSLAKYCLLSNNKQFMSLCRQDHSLFFYFCAGKCWKLLEYNPKKLPFLQLANCCQVKILYGYKNTQIILYFKYYFTFLVHNIKHTDYFTQI